MKLLLTGGCGYVGTSLTQELLAQGHTVHVVDIQWFGNYLQPHPHLTIIQDDIRNASSWNLRGFDAILHLANVANDPCSDLNSKLNWEVNALASMFLIERAIKDGVKQFIFASSGSVYGVKEEPEVTEDLDLVPISDYNKTKMVSERVLLSYADQILVNIVRPATVCGYSPRMRLDLSVNMLTMQALANGKITVFGGDQTRPNINLKDMIRVYLHLLAHGEKLAGIYNAGFENISIMEIAQRVTRHVPAEIVVTPSNDPRSYRLSSKKLLATGFEPKFTVEDAILEVIDAYHRGVLKMEDRWFNIKTMLQIPNLA
ncbi:MAG: SDR family oxidoreductase [Verrucomicrobiia bacterium]